MADTLTTQSTTLATVPSGSVIATDDAGASGHVQIVKLARSADGSAVAITADADGLLVNLGANNDVTVTGSVAVTDNSGSLTVDDGGSSLTVDGTVAVSGTVAVTDNSGSLTVDNAALSVTGGGVEVSALRVTLASDSTGVLSVDDNGSTISVDDGAGSLTVDGTVAVSAVSGVVDVTPSSPAANDYLPVRLTDGSSFVSVGGGTQYTEDAASAGAESLTLAGSVRRDTAASSAGTDGDYATINTDASGRLWVNASGAAVPVTDNSSSLTVDNGGTFAVQDSEKVADNAGFTDGTTKVLPAGFIYDEIAGTALTENDAAAARINVNRAQVATLEDGTTRGRYATVTASNALKVDASAVAVPVTDNSGSLTVDNAGTFAVQATLAAGATNIAKAEDVAAADADVGVPAMAVRKATPANTSNADGDYEFLQMSAGRLWASATIDAALPAGTNAIGKLAANSGVDIGDVDILSIAAGANLIGYVGGKNTYAAKATITWTGTSLANGSARESTVIDNTTNRYRDVRIRIQTKGQTSGTAYIDWYVYTALGDTTYTDAATGSDAAFTAANRFNSRYLGSTKCNAGTSAVQSEFLLSDSFATCPDKWGLIGINNTGAALSATAGDHVLEYEGIN